MSCLDSTGWNGEGKTRAFIRYGKEELEVSKSGKPEVTLQNDQLKLCSRPKGLGHKSPESCAWETNEQR